jgi:hypothetical protein
VWSRRSLVKTILAVLERAEAGGYLERDRATPPRLQIPKFKIKVDTWKSMFMPTPADFHELANGQRCQVEMV